VDRGPSEVERMVLQAVHDLSAGVPTVDVTQEAAAHKAGLSSDSREVNEALAALVDWWYVKGTNVLGQRIYRITACILPWRQTYVSTTKTGKERKIYIGPRTVEVLKAHRARQLEERMAATSWADPGLVFPNTRGKIRRRDSVMRSFRRFLEEVGVPVEVRFHDLRHTAGTLALRQGVPLHTVSRMLGTSDPATTLRRYAHVLEEMREDAARAMDELF
jgi:integrase